MRRLKELIARTIKAVIGPPKGERAEIPRPVMAKVWQWLALVPCGAAVAALLVIAGAGPAGLIGAFIAAYGAVSAWLTWRAGICGEVKSVECVVLMAGRSGLRDQYPYVMAQTPDGEVYRVPSGYRGKEWNRGDILRFHANAGDIDEPEDGVMRVRRTYAIERLSAAFRPDEEEEDDEP